MAIDVTRLVPDETVLHKYAALQARPLLRALVADARAYPASYDHERLMMEADAILDDALDNAAAALRAYPVEAMRSSVSANG